MSLPRLLRPFLAVLAALAAAPSPATTHAYITSRAEDAVDIVDTASNSIITRLPTGTRPTGVAARPDGREVWITNATSNDITVIRAWQRTVRQTFPVCTDPFGIVFSPDSTRAYVSCKGSNTIAVVDVATRSVTANLPTLQQPNVLAINNDGSRLVVGSEGINGSYMVFNTATNATVLNHPATFRVTGIVIDELHSVMYVGTPAAVYVALTSNYSATSLIGTGGVTALAHQPLSRTIFMAMAETPPVQPTLRAREGWAGPDLGAVTIGGDTVSVDYSPEHNRIYVVDGSVRVVRVIDRASLSHIATINVSGRPGSFGRFLVTPAPPAPAQPPTGVAAVAGAGSASVSFTPSGDDGYGTVSGFRAACGDQFVDGPASPLTVTGLRNNQTVTCTVATINEAGPGAPSQPSNPITPDAPPTAPLITQVRRGDHALIVHFVPGAENFASPIIDYTARCGAHTRSGTASPIVVDGLALGVALSCTVGARNRVGDSPLSDPSASVTTATLPGAPTLISALSRDAAIEVAFTAPASDGGAPVTNYVASCGTHTQSATASPITVSGLTNNQTYTCSVAATSEVGTGAASAPSAGVIPDGPPTAPFLTHTESGDRTVYVHFIPGPDNQASPATRYIATCGTATGSGAASPVAVGGLDNGVPVTCFVIARNGVGDSPPSATSTHVTPATVPGAPQLTNANAGDGSVFLAFAEPASDGGEAITGYLARCGSQVQTGTASPIVLNGLTNGQTYTCTVAARNLVGTGAASNGLDITPRMSADVSITLDNGVTYIEPGTPIDYLIDVHNDSAYTITGARVRDTLDAEFASATWVCSNAGGGQCPVPPDGTGNLDALVTLPPHTRVSFLLTTAVPPLPELPISNTASVSVPNDVADPATANNSATDGPDLRVLFRDDFD
jgi:YVTN family beta-propeller protein